MESLVEENGNTSIDPLDTSGQVSSQETNNVQQNSSNTNTVLTSAANIVQFLPAQSIQAQSVIQANQSSVIQTAANVHPVALSKGVLYLNKGSTVIHTTPANTLVQIKPEPHTAHMIDTNSEESLTDEDSPKRRREITRRPSYNRILKDITCPDIAATTLQIANMNSGESTGIHTISSGGGGSAIVHLDRSQEAQFYVPVLGGPVIAEDQSRKREIRLQKNREAARECRRKKKEYIKCLENRVAVLENQNKALIDELKTLKELYCQQKND
uniref:Putative camp response element binding protein n=1 Tax=Tabanus bromius TaxID=304241 RepID=A0A0K8TPF6_TABBR